MIVFTNPDKTSNYVYHTRPDCRDCGELAKPINRDELDERYPWRECATCKNHEVEEKVIMSGTSRARKYHTRVCRIVKKMDSKRTKPISIAERMDLDECHYCKHGNVQHEQTREYVKALKEASNEG